LFPCRVSTFGLGSNNSTMSKLSLTRDKIYKTVARQLHGVVPCWVCGLPVLPAEATLEHIRPLSEGGNSHQENLAISHDRCNNQRHIQSKAVTPPTPSVL
jgi:5-methylcytosine-specific restriction endonuclease McrA